MNWPDISIIKEDSHYLFKWGVLSGPVYETGEVGRSYLPSLEPLMRTFNVHQKKGVVDSLFTGSLKYIKTN